MKMYNMKESEKDRLCFMENSMKNFNFPVYDEVVFLLLNNVLHSHVRIQFIDRR